MCDYFKNTEIMQRICHLINNKATGNPKQLVEKLEVSESTIKRIIGDLKDRGLPIQYCRIKNSYVCKDGAKIIFTLRLGMEPLSKEGMQEIMGGYSSLFCKKIE